MKKVKDFIKSLRFYIFLMISIIGIVSVFVIRGVCLYTLRHHDIVLTAGMRRQTMIISLILCAAIAAAALLVSYFMTRPFKRLSRSINDVQGGLEDVFKPVNDYSETAELSEACDALIQRLQVLDQSQHDFMSNVSHELKTPLTSMKVLADSLTGQEDVPVELYREFMVDIGEEIDRENELIDNLLSMVKTERSSADMNFAPVNVGDMLEKIRKEMNPIAQSRGVQLLIDIERPVVAEIDEMRVTQAVTNLIENAVKYNHAGGWVRITLDADHQNFYITVADNGVGIPEDAQEQIFERFYRADKSHSNEISGTGLGLSLARNAVILHRGSIKVKSTPDEGSEFTVRIPLSPAQV